VFKFFIISILISLSGCASTPPTVNVATQVMVPDELILDCVISPPPDKTTYLNTNLVGREELLVNYSSELLHNASVCNKRLSLLRAWKIEVMKNTNKE